MMIRTQPLKDLAKHLPEKRKDRHEPDFRVYKEYQCGSPAVTKGKIRSISERQTGAWSYGSRSLIEL